MEKGKFNITVKIYDDDDKYVETKQMEVDGWTHNGLGYYKTNSEYTITHLATGSYLYHARSKREAEDFINMMTRNINYDTNSEDYTNEILTRMFIFNSAKNFSMEE